MALLLVPTDAIAGSGFCRLGGSTGLLVFIFAVWRQFGILIIYAAIGKLYAILFRFRKIYPFF
jgi:hypothetical protein